MLSFIRRMTLIAVVFIAAAALAGAPTESRAQTGTVRLHIVKAGFIVGIGGGSGTLIYHGARYPLTIGGIGVGSLGVAAVDLVGTAYNLRTPADIVGSYGAAVPAPLLSVALRWHGYRMRRASSLRCMEFRSVFKYLWAWPE